MIGALVAVALLGGCDHSAPFAGPAHGDLGPRGVGNPLQITYNPGTDLRPRWLPDGSGFVYTAERIDRADRDRCLARLAAAGGTILERICDAAPTSDDTTTVFEQAAVTGDGRLAYVRAGAPAVLRPVAPRTRELRLGALASPEGVIVRSFPYSAPSGRVHQAPEALQWAGSSQLVYLAQDVRYEEPCRGCELDTIGVGIEIVTLQPGTGAPVLVPGTDSATGAAVAGTDTLYYTVASSNLMYRRVLSTGVVTTVATFFEPVREVAAGGGRLAAITGAGSLWLVDPGVNPVLLSSATARSYRRPAVSPDGRRIIVEGYARVTLTAFSRSADLWLFDLP